MSKKFSVIIADCPWSFSDALRHSSVKRGADDNYDTMSIDDLCALPVKKVSDPTGCVLALWAVGSQLEEALKVMGAWGFKQKQVYVWCKTKKKQTGDNILGFGMGKLFRQTHEICLIGINNTGIYKQLRNKSQRSVCLAQNNGHSIKPDALHDSLDTMFPNCLKLELFARRKKEGWLTLGNEINGKDINDELNDLINA